MKIKLTTTCLIAGLLLTPAIGMSADTSSNYSNAKEYVKDSAITAKIKAKLAEEKMASLTQITVDTDKNGVVYLSGVAETQDAVNKAHAIAHATEGVKSVKNHITIKKSD